MLTDCLLGLAWLAIVLLPAVIACRHMPKSRGGYADPCLNPSRNSAGGPEAASSALGS
jgi:hypothetical protein